MKEIERYGAIVDGMEWEIDLERERLISFENPKLVRRLNKIEIKHIKELISEKNGRKSEM